MFMLELVPIRQVDRWVFSINYVTLWSKLLVSVCRSHVYQQLLLADVEKLGLIEAGASKAGCLGEVKDERMSETSKSDLFTRECNRLPKVTKRVVCTISLASNRVMWRSFY